MDQFSVMMNRLWFIITWPSSILAILFGLWMIVLVPNWLLENWMIAKLGFVFLLIIYHLKTHFILKELNLIKDWDFHCYTHKPLDDIYKNKLNKIDVVGFFSQKTALSGKIQRIPPRGSVTSPLKRGISCRVMCATV